MCYQAATMDSFESVGDLLSEWRGSAVQLWQYSVTHSMLVIRLDRHSDIPGNLHVECLGVQHFSGYVSGGQANFKVEESQRLMRDSGRSISMMKLSDSGDSRLRIICEEIVVKKNVDPVY